MNFTFQEKQTLLNIAEWSIQEYLSTGKRHELPGNFMITEGLFQHLGAFVTLYYDHQLRGCIGTFSESEPLFENVRRMAIQSAAEDRRFRPINIKELSKLEIEISVLTPRVKIDGPEDIEIGKHGIYLINGFRHATLLPQVALKSEFSPEQFLECCAEKKLGLAKDSWKESEIYVYEAIVINKEPFTDA